MKLDRTKLSIVDLHDSSDKEYWWSLTPGERWEAMQFFREIAYGKDAANGRLQRVLEIIDRE
jgi:hypothetical protein